jgi:hypothetical protein
MENFRWSMHGSTASVVESSSAVHQSFGSKPSRRPELWRWYVRCQFSRRELFTWRERVTMAPGPMAAFGSAPCPGFPIQHCPRRFRDDVDHELLANAVPMWRDKNYRLNSDVRGLRALDRVRRTEAPFCRAQSICNTGAAMCRRTGIYRTLALPLRRLARHPEMAPSPLA